MNYTIERQILDLNHFAVNSLLFIPKPEIKINCYAIFTHGYTGHKGDILTWGQRLADCGITVLLFDLPGHFLGSFNDVPSFTDFKVNAYKLFDKAITYFNIQQNDKLIIGGHSLGAFLALQSLNYNCFNQYQTICICVGLGIQQQAKSLSEHNSIFHNMLKERSNLISKNLAPQKMFTWFYDRINSLSIYNQKIFLISGTNDFLIQENHISNLQNTLSINNQVTVIRPDNLPHHCPDRAVIHIRKLLKTIGYIL